MKKFLFIIGCLASLPMLAQHETLLKDIDLIGAFGGPIITVSSINGQVGADVGGGGAIILNSLFLGGYGMGTDFSDADVTIEGEEIDYNIDYGHGGLWLGYLDKHYKAAHLFSSLKIGWGSAKLEADNAPNFRDRIFVLTPEIGVELNITSFFRIAVTGGYRWVNGINDLPGLDNNDFSSPVGILTFSFGGFGDTNDWDFD